MLAWVQGWGGVLLGRTEAIALGLLVSAVTQAPSLPDLDYRILPPHMTNREPI
jgi:hypothetical protein